MPGPDTKRRGDRVGGERVYYDVVFTVTRGKPVFLNPEIDELLTLSRSRVRFTLAHRD